MLIKENYTHSFAALQTTTNPYHILPFSRRPLYQEPLLVATLIILVLLPLPVHKSSHRSPITWLHHIGKTHSVTSRLLPEWAHNAMHPTPQHPSVPLTQGITHIVDRVVGQGPDIAPAAVVAGREVGRENLQPAEDVEEDCYGPIIGVSHEKLNRVIASPSPAGCGGAWRSRTVVLGLLVDLVESGNGAHRQF
jgi:hypothetical protein